MATPSFLFIGAQKAGTTSLREFLGSIPEKIFMLKSEQHFWNREGHYKDGYGLSAYQQLFDGANHSQLTGEKSPNYLTSFDAPARIARHLPDIKLIAILRNPSDRAYSAYWHGRRVGAIDPNVSFGQSIRSYELNHGKPYGDLLTPGLYSQHLLRYREFFTAKQILILDFQKILSAPEEELTRSLLFLGLTNEVIAELGTLQFPLRNVARVSRFPALSKKIHESRLLSYERKAKLLRKLVGSGYIPPMSEMDRSFLADFYKDEARKVEAITGERFKWSFSP